MKSLLVSAGFAFALLAPLTAQQTDLPGMVDESIRAMNEQRWEDALQISTAAVDQFSKSANTYGPLFGSIYYRKGLSEMKLGRFEEAMKSFEICYRDFPNAANTPAPRRNPFHKMALLRWGEAAMGAKQWQVALSQFDKFMKERDSTVDKVQPGQYYVNIAICNYQLGQIPAGNEAMETASQNKYVYPTPDALIMHGFQTMLSAAITAKNEQAIIDFIQKNRGDLVVEPYEMPRYYQQLLKLAGDAVNHNMLRASVAIYQLVPSDEAMREDCRAMLKRLGDAAEIQVGRRVIRKTMIEQGLEVLEKNAANQLSVDAMILPAAALIHDRSGNTRGANAAYRLLEKFHPRASGREQNLYNLMRTYTLLGEPVAAQSSAEKFLKAFPSSELTTQVRKLLVSQLFAEANYSECAQVATSLMEKSEAGSAAHDVALHYLAASRFYLGDFVRAEPLLEQHIEAYPESPFRIASRYFQASIAMRMQYWSKAARLLDQFVKDFPESSTNPYLPFALLDRANCHYVEGQADQALEKLTRIIDEFPSSRVVAEAYSLRGIVMQAEGEAADAEKAYAAALEMAESRNDAASAGEALYYLIRLIVSDESADQTRMERAAAYANQFWKKYADDSPYLTEIASIQYPALKAVGRRDEALERLRDVIAQVAKQDKPEGLEEAINVYTHAYLEERTADELKEHYYAFPGIRSTDRTARALLRIAIIGVYENLQKTAQSEADQRAASASIRATFQELKKAFSPKDLPGYVLIQLGDYLRTHTSAPREALPYYEELLERSDPDYQFAALLGRADVLGRSDKDADLDAAIADLERILKDSKTLKQQDFALYRIIEILMKQEAYEKAADRAREYLSADSNFRNYIGEVSLLMARSFDLRGLEEDAMAMYLRVWSGQQGYIKVSAPALMRWMELLWERNKPGNPEKGEPSDRQGAYNGAYQYLKVTRPVTARMTPEDLALWKEVEAQAEIYAADPSVTPAGSEPSKR